jgi:hypothetical protein
MKVMPGFFAAYKTDLLAGRDFRPLEGAGAPNRAAIVNEAFARRHFAGMGPIGRTFLRIDADGRPSFQIVGLVCDAKYNSLRGSAPPMIYVPISAEDKDSMTVAVRSGLDPAAVASIFRRELRSASPGFHLQEVTTLDNEIGNTLRKERLLARLSTFFGAVALLLTSVGLFGMMSYLVVRRTREIGLRIALGARTGSVIQIVLSRMAVFFAAGLVLGAALAAAATRWIESLLYGVRPLDPASWTAAIVILTGVAAIAALAPAVRAARMDPASALRLD